MAKSNNSQKYELSAGEVLKMLNLSPSQYIAEKDRSLSAVKGDEKNIQPYQWVIYKKVNGIKGERVNIDTSKIPGGQAYNTYARSTENGIVINRQLNLSNILGNNTNDSNRIGPSNNSFDNNQSSETFTGTDSVSSTCEIVNYNGHDEDIIKHMMFAKLQLLKECYESVGELF